MTKSVYPIHQAVGRPVTIKGLVGQYILLAAGSLIGDLFLFIVLYICGVPHLFCIALCFALGSVALWGSWTLSRIYGEHGLMKQMARRGLPKSIRWKSRQTFIEIKIRDNERHTAHPGDR
jgi:hypothetical protein